MFNQNFKEIIYLASENQEKLKAVYDGFSNFYHRSFIVRVINITSNISEHPIDLETKQGAKNRMDNLRTFLDDNNIKYDYCVSLQSGSFSGGVISNKLFGKIGNNRYDSDFSDDEEEDDNFKNKRKNPFDFCCCVIWNGQGEARSISMGKLNKKPRIELMTKLIESTLNHYITG